jgi:hypothetical protein
MMTDAIIEIGPVIISQPASGEVGTRYRFRWSKPFYFSNSPTPSFNATFYYSKEYLGEQYVHIIQATPGYNPLGLPIFATSLHSDPRSLTFENVIYDGDRGSKIANSELMSSLDDEDIVAGSFDQIDDAQIDGRLGKGALPNSPSGEGRPTTLPTSTTVTGNIPLWLQRIFETVVEVLRPIAELIRKIIEKIKEFFSNIFNTIMAILLVAVVLIVTGRGGRKETIIKETIVT